MTDRIAFEVSRKVLPKPDNPDRYSIEAAMQDGLDDDTAPGLGSMKDYDEFQHRETLTLLGELSRRLEFFRTIFSNVFRRPERDSGFEISAANVNTLVIPALEENVRDFLSSGGSVEITFQGERLIATSDGHVQDPNTATRGQLARRPVALEDQENRRSSINPNSSTTGASQAVTVFATGDPVGFPNDSASSWTTRPDTIASMPINHWSGPDDWMNNNYAGPMEILARPLNGREGERNTSSAHPNTPPHTRPPRGDTRPRYDTRSTLCLRI